MPPLASSIHFEASPAKPSASRTYILYFITGNPGVIEYYRPFLTHLYDLLTTNPTTSPSNPDNPTSTPPNASTPANLSLAAHDIDIQIYGRSLSGFELPSTSTSTSPDLSTRGPPYNVTQQITTTQRSIHDVVNAAKANGARDVRVILIGHSLGTYMTLEVMRQLREEHKQDPEKGVRVVGGVCLFATIMEIAKSRSGKRLSHILTLPHFPLFISTLARIATFLIPTVVLAYFVRIFASQPQRNAYVTASLIKSRMGLRQLLYLAADEMGEISADKWDEEIWGAADSATTTTTTTDDVLKRPYLHFLFGEDDHWVSNEVRDTLITKRGRSKSKSESESEREKWRPNMEIDDQKWPHDFVMKHSEVVAVKTGGYVCDVILRDLGVM